MAQRIAILGAHPGTRDRAPFGDPGWLVWGCSWTQRHLLPRIDAWFEVHRPRELKKLGMTPGDLEAYRCQMERHREVYLNHWLDWRLARAHTYPQAVKHLAGPENFDSTPGYMLAFLVHGGGFNGHRDVTDVAIYGVGMDAGTENECQRRAFFELVRQAREKGIQVTAPGSDLLN